MRDLSVQHLPCPLFAFVVKLSNDSVFLIHVGSMHFLQFSERVKLQIELQNYRMTQFDLNLRAGQELGVLACIYEFVQLLKQLFRHKDVNLHKQKWHRVYV